MVRRSCKPRPIIHSDLVDVLRLLDEGGLGVCDHPTLPIPCVHVEWPINFINSTIDTENRIVDLCFATKAAIAPVYDYILLFTRCYKNLFFIRDETMDRAAGTHIRKAICGINQPF